ncbi:MAG: leucine--tRNA ligase, partial [Eubacteriales bacterium]|nr:leucine--tRNA ligase [Eubacteriales bacterium]
MRDYDPKAIERKWQDLWENEGTFRASEDKSLPKYFPLVEFPYPSGQGLHVGHPRPYTALDIIARKRRLEGFNVLYAIGWDAFGLPTENFAIKNRIHPKEVTEKNIKRFKQQLMSLGFSFDWTREVNTTDPKYYKWTQWIFLKLYEKGLAYKTEMPINWCVDCKIGLANEEVVNGVCERCGGEVVRRIKSQWMLKITKYAEKLLEDLDRLDYIERVKTQQRNWIGRSEGADVEFAIKGTGETLKVYTTRPDTLFGATYMVVSPEHPVLEKFADMIGNLPEVKAYREFSSKRSDFERTELSRDKSGVEIKGLLAVNPATGKEIPIWISDYILMSYGTGAIMAVPGHDTRDWEFAKKFNLPIVEVVSGGNIEKEPYTDIEHGTMVNSGMLNGLEVADAKIKIIKWLEENRIGSKRVNFKLRDWVFSRQRYWGEPIPLVFCEHCGWVPIPEKELPVMLPEVESYEPTETGESPLSKIESWVSTTCPSCGRPAKRETDTMPQWAGSSWYYIRYTDPFNADALSSPENMKYWLPVDWYNGGMEHTTLHLLYSRFWHKFLYDCRIVPTPEPYLKRTSHGMILGENNEKMSKSRGNVVNPEDMVDEFGADTLRMYEMFIGDFEKSVPWAYNGVKGCRRFLERVWKMREMLKGGDSYSKELEILMNQTIKKVSQDFESMKFNTAIATLMSFTNAAYDKGSINAAELKTFLILLNPVSPHITEEIWELARFPGKLSGQTWPVWDEAKTVEDNVEIAIQINGKVRERITVSSGLDKDSTENEALGNERVKDLIAGKTVIKVIAVPGSLVNIV